MNHMLDLDGLRAFVAVVETMSFSKGGALVGRTQSAVSLQLARLEHLLGKQLIQRRRGRVEGLTEDGRALLPYARRMVDLNEAAWRSLGGAEAVERVRAGVPADFMDAGFPEVLRGFQRAHPGVELDVVSDVSARLRDKALAGELDLAFFKRRPGEGEGEAVARQSLLWVGNRLTVADDLAELPLVLFPEGCVFRQTALAALERVGRRARIAYASASMESVRAAILAGLGVGALPPSAILPDMVPLDDAGLPPLAEVEVAVLLAPRAGPAARFLSRHLSRRLVAPAANL